MYYSYRLHCLFCSTTKAHGNRRGGVEVERSPRTREIGVHPRSRQTEVVKKQVVTAPLPDARQQV